MGHGRPCCAGRPHEDQQQLVHAGFVGLAISDANERMFATYVGKGTLSW